MSRVEIPRDRWGRPLIIPLDANGKPDLDAKLVPYLRVSTVAGTLDDKSNLMKWKQRVTALGLIRRPDLQLAVQSILARYDDPLNTFEAKKELNKILDSADEAGGANVASTKGTAYHELTEAVDGGRDLPPALPADVRQRIEEYQEATAPYHVLDIETFVVNDITGTAGTFDRLLGAPDGRVHVEDLKTGKDDPNYPLKVAIQIATYAHGFRYDPTTGVRTPIHPDLDKTTGLLVHMPERGTGTRIYELDLVKGWEAALVAAEVYRVRQWKKETIRKELVLV